MKFVLSAIVALSAVSAFADSESFPTPLPTGVIGTTTYSNMTPGSYTGSEQYPVQPTQNLKYKAIDCRLAQNQEFLVCRNGGNQ
jgi:hypothetical protein